MANLILRMHEGDNAVDRALNNLTAGRNSEVVTVSGGLGKLSEMVEGDELIILGHGNPNSLGGKSPTDMAALLSENHLRSGIHINLVACNSGTGSAPYALELKVQLVGKKIVPASVAGGTNLMWVKPDGTPYAKTGAGVEVTEGWSNVDTPWGTRKAHTTPSYKTGS